MLGAGRLGLLVAQVLGPSGCRLTVVGRHAERLAFCEKQGIQTRTLEEFVPRATADVVVDCTGVPQGLELAARAVRPRGKIVLKSTCSATAPVNLADIVINEVTVIGRQARDYVWLMSRNPTMKEAEYEKMKNFIASIGYDVGKLKKVPQRW